MRVWEYTLADGRTVSGGNDRHAAVSYWEPGRGANGTWTHVDYVRLTDEAYGVDCPLPDCWCHADTWTTPSVATRPLASATV